MSSFISIIGLIVFIGSLFAAVLAFSAWIFELLWNWVLPDLFHVPMITFWQSVGIVLLLSFIGGVFKKWK